MRSFKRVMITGPEATQAPFAEYMRDLDRWRIWQSFSADVRSGTYLELYPNGQVDRVTVLNWMVQDITIISGPAK